MKLYKRKWVIIRLFLGHPSLSVQSWIEDEGGQKYSSESELHISATTRENTEHKQPQLVALECSNFMLGI